MNSTHDHRIFFTLCCLIITLSTNAQKELLQNFDAHEINTVYINSNDIFEIHIKTRKTTQISINTRIDGETFESSLLKTAHKGDRLEITTGRTPDFIPFNDKLAAHKVMSIVLELEIPEYMNLDIYSTLASVDGNGSFGQVQIDLGRGGCRFTGFRFRESAHINTLSGTISLEVFNAEPLAQSRNGSVVISPDIMGNQKLVLKSIHGDITVKKSL